ncbi:hypothetical protein C2W64_02162 [Brevibacillus laterosporus]|nr:hypothetical protein C2W64_02162 [Brevibacillus laterosporus]
MVEEKEESQSVRPLTEEELAQRQKQAERLYKQERSAINQLEQELGALLEESQRFSNQRLGSDLGKLSRGCITFIGKRSSFTR